MAALVISTFLTSHGRYTIQHYNANISIFYWALDFTWFSRILSNKQHFTQSLPNYFYPAFSLRAFVASFLPLFTIVSMVNAMIQTLPIGEGDDVIDKRIESRWHERFLPQCTKMRTCEEPSSDDASVRRWCLHKRESVDITAKNPVAMTPPFDDDAFTSKNPSMSQHSMPAKRRGYPISDDIDDEGDRWRRFCR